MSPIRRVTEVVVPGGLVCMLEISWDHLAAPKTSLFAEVARIIVAAFERTGANIDMSVGLHAAFRAAHPSAGSRCREHLRELSARSAEVDELRGSRFRLAGVGRRSDAGLHQVIDPTGEISLQRPRGSGAR